MSGFHTRASLSIPTAVSFFPSQFHATWFIGWELVMQWSCGSCADQMQRTSGDTQGATRWCALEIGLHTWMPLAAKVVWRGGKGGRSGTEISISSFVSLGGGTANEVCLAGVQGRGIHEPEQALFATKILTRSIEYARYIKTVHGSK